MAVGQVVTCAIAVGLVLAVEAAPVLRRMVSVADALAIVAVVGVAIVLLTGFGRIVDQGFMGRPADRATIDIGLRDDTATTDEDTVLRVPTPGVLPNDGDAIAVTEHHPISRAGARVTVEPDGGWGYDPTVSSRLQRLGSGEETEDRFRYRASDGAEAQWATVRVVVVGKDEP